MVGASFLLTFQIPTEHQDLQDVEDRVDTFKAFSKKMDDSVLQLSTVASELVRKHVGGFRKEFQKLGSAFQAISHAFQMDPPFSSEALNNAISHTGRTYEAVGEMFAEQPKSDLFQMLDTLSLYQGLLSNFPDIIHLQKGKTQCRQVSLPECGLCWTLGYRDGLEEMGQLTSLPVLSAYSVAGAILGGGML
jgi:sorting nexin-9/18/33